MTAKRTAAVFGICLAAGTAVQAAAEGVNLATGGEKGGEAAVRLLALSRQLVDYGRANNDPLPLIVAAGMRQRVALAKVERAPDAAGSPATGEPLTAAAILDEAKAISGGDETIAAMADDVAAAADKGRSVGPGYNLVDLPPKGEDTYSKVPFDGGVYAEVYAEGEGSTDLDLYVYDEDANLVCSDTDSSDVAYCGWTPSWSGGFTIRVVNQGARGNTYALITN